MGTLIQDLRYGLRMLRKNPDFTAVAVLTLALGIGANTAMFTVVDGVLLRPLSFPHPERLMAISGLTRPTMVDPLAWWGHNHSFDQLVHCFSGGVNLASEGSGERTSAAVVSASFFRVLGVWPILGRGFLAEEETPGRNRVVVLSYGLWIEPFGKDPAALGRAIRLNGIPHTIVGVMPVGFSFPGHVRLWVPEIRALLGEGSLDLGSNPSDLPGAEWNIGRLKPGVRRIQAEAEMTVLSWRLQEKYGDKNYVVANQFVHVRPLQEAMVGDVRPALLALFAGITLVLLIACANTANMLLARAAVRQKEVAIRLCLGANRLRVLRQLLTESVLLALIGGSLGVLFAVWLVKAFGVIAPASIPRLEGISVDPRVLIFLVCVSSLTGILVGLAPALQTLTPQLIPALKEEGHRSTGSLHGLVRACVMVGEVSLALVLLTGAGLMIRSLYRLTRIELGFNPQNVITMEIALPQAKYGASPQKTGAQKKQEEQETAKHVSQQQAPKDAYASEEPASGLTAYAAFHQRLLQGIGSLPGILAVGATGSLLLGRGGGGLYFDVHGKPTGLGRVFVISGDYFRAMGIPLLAGRTFSENDTGSAPRVVIISQSLARGVWGSKSPIGDQLLIEGEDAQREIVGVVGDVTSVDYDAGTSWQYWQFYLRHLQGYRSGVGPLDTTLIVRTSSDAKGIVPLLRSRVLEADRDLPVFNIKTMEDVISEYAAPQRFRGFLLGLFAFVAVALAGVGVYGVTGYSATLRTHEIGIRISLGGSPREVLLMIMGEGVRRALLGISLGLLAALGLNRLISSLLFGISAFDATTYVGSATVLFVVASLASYVPARRATKVDPMVALRYE